MAEFTTCGYCGNQFLTRRTACPFCQTPRDGHPDGGVREPRPPAPPGLPPVAVRELVPS